MKRCSAELHFLGEFPELEKITIVLPSLERRTAARGSHPQAGMSTFVWSSALTNIALDKPQSEIQM